MLLLFLLPMSLLLLFLVSSLFCFGTRFANALEENTSNKGQRQAKVLVKKRERERLFCVCVCVCVVLFYCVLYSILLISPTSIPAQSATAASLSPSQPNSLPAISTWSLSRCCHCLGLCLADYTRQTTKYKTIGRSRSLVCARSLF